MTRTRAPAEARAKRADKSLAWLASAVTIGGLLFLPSLLEPFKLILATQIVIYCVVALSLQLLWGRAG